MQADSDAALVARVVADDDRAAFELLVRRHQSSLRAFLRRLLRNDDARADDLAQETFIKLYRSIGSFRGQAKFTTWLYRIACNTWLDHCRRSGSAEFTSLEDVDAIPDGTDAGAMAASQMDAGRALALLSPRQRAVFELSYGKGMTHEEVADALGQPVGTVKSDLARGLARLRQAMAPEERPG
jgi:RNA polymerase sigma factor (sigma-70 family)